MKLFERLIDHHGWSMDRILESCRPLSDDQLDAELSARCPFPWHDCAETLRSLLAANSGFAEPWLDSINGEKVDGPRETLGDLQKVLSENCERFKTLVNSIEEEGRWDMTFVDALCDPPEVFSYLGVVGHVITFNAYRRVLLLNELKRFGITDLGFGDPIEYDPARRS